jgi:methylglutaconyl-CoA hydratase
MTPLARFPLRSRPFTGATVRVEGLAHGVARLVLDRPRVRNAFDPRMVRELDAALALLAELDPDAGPDGLRLLLLEGEGPVFCAGADLRQGMGQADAAAEANLESALALGRMFRRLAGFPVPVLARVQGAAMGGGLGLAACCDFVLADPAARFATSEVRLGLVPAVIGPYLVRRLGLARAAPLMLTGRRIPAPEALELGLVQRLEAPGEPPEAALTRVLEDFLAAGPEAARATRALLLAAAPLPAPELEALAARTLAAARASTESRDGIRAFFAAVPPPWAPPEAASAPDAPPGDRSGAAPGPGLPPGSGPEPA